MKRIARKCLRELLKCIANINNCIMVMLLYIESINSNEEVPINKPVVKYGRYGSFWLVFVDSQLLYRSVKYDGLRPRWIIAFLFMYVHNCWIYFHSSSWVEYHCGRTYTPRNSHLFWITSSSKSVHFKHIIRLITISHYL